MWEGQWPFCKIGTARYEEFLVGTKIMNYVNLSLLEEQKCVVI